PDHRALPPFPTRRSSDLRIHAKLRQNLAVDGARLDALFSCIDDPGTPTPRHKPGCGMLEEAIACFKASPGTTAVIGDKLTDLEADRKSTRLNSSHVAISY